MPPRRLFTPFYTFPLLSIVSLLTCVVIWRYSLLLWRCSTAARGLGTDAVQGLSATGLLTCTPRNFVSSVLFFFVRTGA
jgi:hypothetical protein